MPGARPRAETLGVCGAYSGNARAKRPGWRVRELRRSARSWRLLDELRTAPAQSSSFRSLSAFPITETELRVIAALAQIGLISTLTTGYRMPAAIGTPTTL